jgi:hypothetical protein
MTAVSLIIIDISPPSTTTGLAFIALEQQAVYHISARLATQKATWRLMQVAFVLCIVGRNPSAVLCC